MTQKKDNAKEKEQDWMGLDWRERVRFDPRYYRPAEVDDLRA